MFTESFINCMINFKRVFYHSGEKTYLMFFIMYKYKLLSFWNYYIRSYLWFIKLFNSVSFTTMNYSTPII